MNGIPFLVFLLLVIAFLLRVDFIFYIIYVLFGVYAISKWIIPRSIRDLKIERTFSTHAFIGEITIISLKITNQSRIPLPWLQIDESVAHRLRHGPPPRAAFRLGSRASKQIDYRVQASRRGLYKIGPMLGSGGDPFGFETKSIYRRPDYLTVYPRLISLSRMSLPSYLPFGTMENNFTIFEDPARPNGVREYRGGDTPRYINWKVSARQQRLMVRTLQPAIFLETFILLNLNNNDYNRRFRIDSVEWAVVVAASFAANLIDRKQAVGLAVNGVDPLRLLDIDDENAAGFAMESGRLEVEMNLKVVENTTAKSSRGEQLLPTPVQLGTGRAHLMKLLEILARIESGTLLDLPVWISGSCRGLNWGATILIISPGIGDKSCKAVHRLVRLGFNPILIVIEPYTNFKEIQERARILGFTAFSITKESDFGLLQGQTVTSRHYV